MNKTIEAMYFAEHRHMYQARRYTYDPYMKHLAEVAGIVASVTSDAEVLQACWLHDTIEDTDTTYEELQVSFGTRVADMVKSLTDVEEGNRATRKARAQVRLVKAPAEVQTIKYADGISNLTSIWTHDRKFAKTYLKEWKHLLQVMNKGDPFLYAWINRLVNQYDTILEYEEDQGL